MRRQLSGRCARVEALARDLDVPVGTILEVSRDLGIPARGRTSLLDRRQQDLVEQAVGLARCEQWCAPFKRFDEAEARRFLRGPIPVEWLDRRLTLAELAAITGGAAIRFGERWRALRSLLAEGDEIWTFASPWDSWAHHAGRSGVAIVRGGAPVLSLVLVIN